MTPEELRAANVRRFRRLLEGMSDETERARIERLLLEEELKPASAYPASDPPDGR